MSLRLVAAMVTGTSSKEDIKNIKAEGALALGNLVDAVQRCQSRFGGRAELATEDDIRIVELCEKWRKVLSHGLKSSLSFPSALTSPSTVPERLCAAASYHFTATSSGRCLWSYTKLHLTKHEEERFTMLRSINTPVGYFRAFLRAALNERSLERYLHSWIGHVLVSEYYEEGAIIKDSSAISILPNMAGSLMSILFALSIDKLELNEVEIGGGQTVKPEPVIPEIAPVKSTTKSKRKPLRQMIDFEGDQSTSKTISRILEENKSAPPTCLTSPQNKMLSDKPVTSHSEPCTSRPKNNRQFFPDDCLRSPSADSPSQLLSRLSERAREIFSKSKSIDVSLEYGREETPSSSLANLRISESDSEELAQSNSIEGSMSCLELCFADEDVSPSEESCILLREALAKQQKECTTLHLKLAQLEIAHKDKLNKSDKTILDLNRENDRLKEQLRKYVGAVQLLKQDGSQNDELQHYENKLIQVAQMHAELMEFNDHLQKKLHETESLLAVQGKTLTLAEPQIVSNVSIFIPTTFLIGSGSDAHHVYQVFVRVSNDEWNVYHRYAKFRQLHLQLKNSHPDIATFQFPPKKALRKKDAWLVEERRMRLQAYLRHVVLVLPQVRQIGSKRQLVNLLPFLGESCNINPSRASSESSRLSLGKLFASRQSNAATTTEPENSYSAL